MEDMKGNEGHEGFFISSFPFMSFMSSLQSSDAQSVAKREKKAIGSTRKKGEAFAPPFPVPL
jgi:hypothetical protein